MAKSQTFLEQLVAASGHHPDQLAERLKLSIDELLEATHLPRRLVAPVNRDPMWKDLLVYVDERIAGLLAIRQELHKMLEEDRRQQLMDRMRVERIPDPPKTYIKGQR